MTREEIQAKVIELAAEHGGVAATDVTPASHLVNDLNYDSLEEVEFAMDVEDEFGITIADEKVQAVKTVGDAIELVVEHPGAVLSANSAIAPVNPNAQPLEHKCDDEEEENSAQQNGQNPQDDGVSATR